MCLRALGMSKSAAAPKAVLPSGITDESKWRIEILMSKNEEPHVRAIPIDRSQSRPENCAFGSVGLRGFMNTRFGEPNKASALVYWYA
jgi:hypothetical protein